MIGKNVLMIVTLNAVFSATLGFSQAPHSKPRRAEQAKSQMEKETSTPDFKIKNTINVKHILQGGHQAEQKLQELIKRDWDQRIHITKSVSTITLHVPCNFTLDPKRLRQLIEEAESHGNTIGKLEKIPYMNVYINKDAIQFIGQLQIFRSLYTFDLPKPASCSFCPPADAIKKAFCADAVSYSVDYGEDDERFRKVFPTTSNEPYSEQIQSILDTVLWQRNIESDEGVTNPLIIFENTRQAWGKSRSFEIEYNSQGKITIATFLETLSKTIHYKTERQGFDSDDAGVFTGIKPLKPDNHAELIYTITMDT